MDKNDDLNKNIENHDEQNISQKANLKITKKDLNRIGNILNFNHYYNLLKKYKGNCNLSEDFIDNFNNINTSTFQKQKYTSSSLKLRKEIEQMCQNYYKNKNNKNDSKDNIDNKDGQKIKFIDKYNSIINSVNSDDRMKNKKKKYSLKALSQIKVYYNQGKMIKHQRKNHDNRNEEIRHNTMDSTSNDIKIQTKFEYGNYALNNTIFHHPQFYILSQSNYNIKEKLPPIETTNTFRYRKTDNLSNLIPINTQKRKVRDNFYNYYIGMKLSKHKFS